MKCSGEKCEINILLFNSVFIFLHFIDAIKKTQIFLFNVMSFITCVHVCVVGVVEGCNVWYLVEIIIFTLSFAVS